MIIVVIVNELYSILLNVAWAAFLAAADITLLSSLEKTCIVFSRLDAYNIWGKCSSMYPCNIDWPSQLQFG